ncbi:hypothetical protein ACJX0J_032540 [Zea mays]
MGLMRLKKMTKCFNLFSKSNQPQNDFTLLLKGLCSLENCLHRNRLYFPFLDTLRGEKDYSVIHAYTKILRHIWTRYMWGASIKRMLVDLLQRSLRNSGRLDLDIDATGSKLYRKIIIYLHYT